MANAQQASSRLRATVSGEFLKSETADCIGGLINNDEIGNGFKSLRKLKLPNAVGPLIPRSSVLQ